MPTTLDRPGIAHVRFNAREAALYISPEGERRPSTLARYRLVTMPRDADLGEGCPNVRYLRAIEQAANEFPR